jgi:hypothetical protein
MLFENLRVNRVVVHEVFQRTDDREIRPPVFGEALERLSPEALGAFRLRMTEALAGQTKSLEMQIIRYGGDSFLSCGDALIGSTDEEFLDRSRRVATKLAEAQMARRIPGGMLIVFDGAVGAPPVPLVGVIKAETQAGFRRARDGVRAVLEFLQNIFLTPATRLYKIGLMLRTDQTAPKPRGWKAFVFDSNISASNREAAAAYFYEAFLGCALPSDGPYQTAKFFDLTREFVRKSDLDPEARRGLIDSLFVFVREEREPTFTADQFGDRYLPDALRDPFTEFMRGRRFTPNAVVRDTSKMGARLRRRRLKFGADIELSASPEALADKVTIEQIEGEAPASGQPEKWTQIIIREPFSGEQ